MFDIGWGELLVIGAVALIAIGPKELPGVLRMTGQWMGKVRRMASEFQDQFREAMREAEMDDLKKKVDDMASSADSFTNFDPIGTVRKEFENIVGDKPAQDANAAASVSEMPAAPAQTAQVPEQPATETPSTPEPARKAGEGA